jgi:Glycosyl transferases group 1
VRNLVVSTTSRMLRHWRGARAASFRMPPEIPFGQATGTKPRIFYLSPDSTDASGGVRVIYRHVDLLNELGFDATVLHRRRAYRAHWFENQTRVAASRDVVLASHDVLVVPEMYGANLGRLAPGPRLVIFNQGPYHTFSGLSLDDAAKLRDMPVEAILTVSEDGLGLLRAAFANIPVHVVRSVIDGSIFHPPVTFEGRRRLAYSTSRRDVERQQLLAMLGIRGHLAGWELVAIEGMSEREVSEELRSCAIFLSFSQLDGFGLPPAEAMASGCYVIGFHGQGGREYFNAAYCQPIPDTDLLSFARAVEASAAAYESNPVEFSRTGLAASAAVLERYCADGLREDLRTFYGGLGPEPRSDTSSADANAAL